MQSGAYRGKPGMRSSPRSGCRCPNRAWQYVAAWTWRIAGSQRQSTRRVRKWEAMRRRRLGCRLPRSRCPIATTTYLSDHSLKPQPIDQREVSPFGEAQCLAGVAARGQPFPDGRVDNVHAQVQCAFLVFQPARRPQHAVLHCYRHAGAAIGQSGVGYQQVKHIYKLQRAIGPGW